MRTALDRHGGVEVDTQGDGFFVAFSSARGAVAAAEEIQRAMASSPARVRIGLHTGEASLGGDGYVGMDVHRAARICAAAHGGQVLLSQSTLDLVDVPTRSIGEHRLKDLTAPQRLHQLVAAGLPDEFPPPRTLDAVVTNLPVQPTPLVGRERELRDARALLERGDVRLLTLTGPAGAGKTRLALQLAADAADQFGDGVFLVDLSVLRDPALVVPTIAQTVGAREIAGRAVWDALADYLTEKRMLLVVDNVEQVVESAPDVGRLLAACRGLEVVATSREPLRLAGEQEFPVPPLPGAEAVELFVERARAARPGFELDGNRAAVTEICARLDGLPLAIELAAARVKLLAPPKLLERLERRLPLLTAGTRDAPARQRTLSAAIDWSFGLLDPAEQELFARLSVFSGGFTLEASEAVCAATIDGLASLVDKSLLAERATETGEHRFAMLETVREYAHGQLEVRAEVEDLGSRHAEYFLELAAEAEAADREGAPDPERRVAELWEELDNLRAAIAWLRAAGEIENELRLATSAYWVLWRRTEAELHSWLHSALERADGVEPGIRAAALGAAALSAHHAGDVARGREYAEDSLALARELGDDRLIEFALRVLSFEEPDLEKRRRLLQECQRLLENLGDDHGLAWVKVLFAWTEARAKDYEAARPFYEEGIALFRKLGMRWEATNAEIQLAALLLFEHRRREASQLATRCLRTMVELRSPASVAETLEVLAGAKLEADPGLAVRLLGAASSIREEVGQAPDEIQLDVVRITERAAREQLGDEFEREWEAGRARTLEQAVVLALE